MQKKFILITERGTEEANTRPASTTVLSQLIKFVLLLLFLNNFITNLSFLILRNYKKKYLIAIKTVIKA